MRNVFQLHVLKFLSHEYILVRLNILFPSFRDLKYNDFIQFSQKKQPIKNDLYSPSYVLLIFFFILITAHHCNLRPLILRFLCRCCLGLDWTKWQLGAKECATIVNCICETRHNRTQHTSNPWVLAICKDSLGGSKHRIHRWTRCWECSN